MTAMPSVPKMRRRPVSRLLHTTTLLLALAGSSPAAALAMVHHLDQPVPERFRARAETMIRALRPDDAEAAIPSLKTFESAAEAGDAIPLFLRVATNCVRCMTIIARVEEGRLVPEVILNAGEAVLFHDASYGLWGSPAWPAIVFDGSGGSGIGLIRRGELWVVDACSDCNEWADMKRPKPPPPPLRQPPAPEQRSFSEFRRSLGLDAE